MILDSTYAELQKNFEKPGLFRVKKLGDAYKVRLADKVMADKGRVVTISDLNQDIEIAAENSARAAKEPMGSSIIDRFGFDMHGTPGTGKIRGLKQQSEAQNPGRGRVIRESALLLAKTMEESRNTPGVYWVSQGGGSGVLTHALKILKTRKVTFSNTEHHVFFSGPSTNLVQAQQLAYDLNLKFERRAYSLSMHTNFSDIIKAPWQRRKRDPENYSRLQMSVDMCRGPQAAIGGIAIASSLGVGGFGGFLIGAGVAGFTAIAALTKAISPRTQDKIEGKL